MYYISVINIASMSPGIVPGSCLLPYLNPRPCMPPRLATRAVIEYEADKDPVLEPVKIAFIIESRWVQLGPDLSPGPELWGIGSRTGSSHIQTQQNSRPISSLVAPLIEAVQVQIRSQFTPSRSWGRAHHCLRT